MQTMFSKSRASGWRRVTAKTFCDHMEVEFEKERSKVTPCSAALMIGATMGGTFDPRPLDGPSHVWSLPSGDQVVIRDDEVALTPLMNALAMLEKEGV